MDDEADLSGRVIARFSYKNIEQPVTSWIDMFERVLKIMHAEDKSVLSKLAYALDDNDLAAYVSNNPSDLRGASEIEDGLYVEKNTSTSMKNSMLRKLFKLFDADPADLVFYLRDENDISDDEDIAGTRYELRRRYWMYALDFIHEAHGGGSFSNVHASKQNLISGFFGVNGFNICCVANYDSARVEIYMGNASKDYNKAAYDRLISHKAQIEKDLGVPLIWNRGDDIKSCKVSYDR